MTQRDSGGITEIKVHGHLDDSWSEWFNGMAIWNAENGDAILSGPLPDQAALQGVLRKVRDLGLPLISVNQVPAEKG